MAQQVTSSWLGGMYFQLFSYHFSLEIQGVCQERSTCSLMNIKRRFNLQLTMSCRVGFCIHFLPDGSAEGPCAWDMLLECSPFLVTHPDLFCLADVVQKWLEGKNIQLSHRQCTHWFYHTYWGCQSHSIVRTSPIRLFGKANENVCQALWMG